MNTISQLDYSGLTIEEENDVKTAIENGEEFYFHIDEENGQRLKFIINNCKALLSIGCLERNWIEAYIKASHFRGIPVEVIKSVFDACDRQVLQSIYPVPNLPNRIQGTFSLFRGCVGDSFQQGLSWTSSIDKAIWYAAQHRDYNHYHAEKTVNCSLYVTSMSPENVYCSPRENEPEFITYSKKWWKIEVPQSEFVLNRPR